VEHDDRLSLPCVLSLLASWEKNAALLDVVLNISVDDAVEACHKDAGATEVLPELDMEPLSSPSLLLCRDASVIELEIEVTTLPLSTSLSASDPASEHVVSPEVASSHELRTISGRAALPELCTISGKLSPPSASDTGLSLLHIPSSFHCTAAAPLPIIPS
jgi:hypothetical protein